MSDLTVALVLRAVDRLSGPIKRAGRAVGELAREAQRSGRQMRAAAGGSERFTASQRRARQTVDQTTRAVQRQAEALKRLARMREEAARRLRERGLAASAKLAAGGAAASAGAYGVKRLVEGAVNPLREVEKAKGELATLGVKNMQAWVAAARQAQRRISGMLAADFLRAGYDIKSALSNLTDEAAAQMTMAAAWTAKATKASVADMTALFSSSYGIFKSQFPKLSDAQFGSLMAGMTAAAVRQFKTTGAAMRQALQSAGAGAANAGMRMSEQFAALGMMQRTMEPGMAGTALAAYARTAAAAQERFRKMKIGVRVLDEKGNLRSLADVLADLRKRFGKQLSAKEAAIIQKAFGSEEAVRVIQTLWAQEDALRANVRAMRDAAAAGKQVAITMAMRGMANLDDRLVLLAQKWDLLKQQIGEAFQPVLERLIPVVAGLIDRLSAWLQQHPRLAAATATAVVGFGALLAVAGPLMMALSTLVGTLTMAAFAFRLFRAASLRGMAGEILKVGAAMDSVARKRWRLPRLVWRAAIAPLRWAAFIPRLAWRAFVAPLRWAGGIVSRIPWASLAGPLKWGKLISPLRWGRGLIGKAPWARLAGRLGWSALITPLRWGLRFIPVIGWAALAGQLVWDLLIKPLGWDKYVKSGLKSAWSWVEQQSKAGWERVRNMDALDWAKLAMTGLPNIINRIVEKFTGINLFDAGAKALSSLWEGMKSIWKGLGKWISRTAGKIAGAFRISSASPGEASAGRGAMMPQTGRAAAIAAAHATAQASPRQKKAGGGLMRPGLLTLVGERGPELIFPARSAWVASNDNLRRLIARSRAARAALMHVAAAAAVAAPIVSLPPHLAAEAAALPAGQLHRQAAGAGAGATVAAAPAQITVHMTINVHGGAAPRDIAREVDRALRRSLRSALHDVADGGAA